MLILGGGGGTNSGCCGKTIGMSCGKKLLHEEAIVPVQVFVLYGLYYGRMGKKPCEWGGGCGKGEL